MADFVAVLKKTIEGLGSNSPENRQKVYRKARDTVAAKLAAIDPPPSQIVMERQRKALEDAITAVEAGYSGPDAGEDDFENVLAGLSAAPAREPQPSPVAETPVPPAPAEPLADEPAERMAKAPATHSEDEWVLPPAPAGEQAEAVAHAAPDHSDPVLDAGPVPDGLQPVAPMPRPTPPLGAAATAVPADRAPSSLPGGAASGRAARSPSGRRVSGGMIAALVALVVVAAAAYGIWANRSDFAGMLGLGGSEVAGETPAETAAELEPDEAAEEPAAEPADNADATPPEQGVDEPAAQEVEKFTQRLTADGSEVDEGPAGDQPGIGEGTSLAELTPPSDAAPAPAAEEEAAQQPDAAAEDGADPALPVGQRAIFYEERTSAAEASADTGATVWSLVEESPGADLPPEPTIRGDITIPGKDIRITMTIRRNADDSLPASHIMEMIFLKEGGFEGGSIENLLRVAFKQSEADRGAELSGRAVRIADGYFLVALSDAPEDLERNLLLLRNYAWIDIPIVYGSGRRALVTMEKGVPGERIFREALDAWQNATSG